MKRIFLSYARGDDEPFVRRLHHDLTANGFQVWFDRVDMPSRGLTFHQEIRDAVAACERLLLVVGSKAATSAYVQQEWQFAWYQAEKAVTPVLRLGDYPNVPDELKLLHCEDFRNDADYDVHLANLLRQLSEPAPPLGKLIAVPSLPPHFLARSQRLQALRDALRADLEGPVVISGAAARVGLHGMGGIGKSVLAAALAHDRFIRQAFGDGIVWARLGPLRSVVEVMREVHRDLGGDGQFADEREGKAVLKAMLADKALLLVLDDVWRRSDADAFDVLGPRCRALFTTRDAGLLTSLGGTHHLVELLTDAEATRLLAVAAGAAEGELPAAAAEIVKECGRLPLAVALCGALVRRGLGWQHVLEQLRQARIDRIADRHAVEEQHQSVWHAIHVSVEALDRDDQDGRDNRHERERFLELCVFPADETTPEAAAATLWEHTGGLDEWGSAELLTSLAERSLVQISRFDADVEPRRFGLHDLIYDYLQRSAGDIRERHATLLAAYQKKCPVGWPSGPNDGYFFDHLREHLVAVGRADDLATLLQELVWLETKVRHGLAFDLPLDFSTALSALPQESEPRRILKLLDEALRRDIYFIARHAIDYPQALFQCLWNSAWWYDCPEAEKHYVEPKRGWKQPPPWQREGDKLSTLLERWRQQKMAQPPGFPWLRSLRPPQMHLGTAQQAVFRGHEHSVDCVAFSRDGRRIASGSGDQTVRVWDAASGAELACLRRHERGVTSVAFSPDGRRIASGSWDKTVRVWDAASGAELACLRGHESSVTSISFSPDGRRIASGSYDNTLRVWDGASGAELACLRGHESIVYSVALSPDGLRIVSGAHDHTVRVWDVASGTELACLRGHEHNVTSVAFSLDSRRIASGALDCTVRIWDVASGAELACLRGHEDYVFSVAFSPDGRRIASGAGDETVRVWDAAGGAELACLRGHEEGIRSVAFSSDGCRIASGSGDQTVRVWDAASGAELACLRGHEEGIRSVAFSSDGRRIASGSEDTAVRVWDAASGAELACLRSHERIVSSVAFSADGRRIASGSDDGTVRVWDAASGAELACLRADCSVKSVAFSPDGRRIASGSEDTAVRVWDAASGAELACLCGHESSVFSVAFSPIGRRVASGSGDQTVRVWDAASGAELACLCGHESSVFSVAFSPNGRRVASGSGDQTVRVWDAASGECLEVIEGTYDGAAIACGQAAFVMRALDHGRESIVEVLRSGQPVAFFAEPLDPITTHRSGRAWAGGIGSYLCLLQLDGGAEE